MTTEKPQEKTIKTVPAPRLRFKQFEGQGEWEEKPLREIASLITRRAGKETYTPMSITSGVGLVSQVEKFGREIAGAQYKNYYVLEQNDFAYNKSATKEYPEGFLTMHTLEQTGAVPNSIFTCFRADNEQAIPEYLNYLFQGNLHGRWLRKFISVGARANGALTVEASDLMSTPVPLPCGETTLQEQQHIAATLSSLDDLITAHTDKLEALRQHKRGLMQGLFPAEGERAPRLRFPEFAETEEWEEKKLGEVAPLQRGFDLPNSQLVEGNVPVVYSNGIQNYHNTSMAQAPALVTGRSGTMGKLHFIESGPYWPHNTTLWVTDFNGNDPKFVYFLYDAIDFTRFASGSGVPTLNRNDAHAFKAFIPALPEQQRIADALSSLDDLITAQGDKIAALQEFKRGLMQGLFPSTTSATQGATE